LICLKASKHIAYRSFQPTFCPLAPNSLKNDAKALKDAKASGNKDAIKNAEDKLKADKSTFDADRKTRNEDRKSMHQDKKEHHENRKEHHQK